MRKLWGRMLLIVALVVPALAGPAAPATAGPVPAPVGAVRMLDFNLCGGYTADCRPTESTDVWANLIADQVKAWDTDVATFQEVCDGQQKLLANRLPGYRVAWFPGRTGHTGCDKWQVPGVVANRDFGIAIFVRGSAFTRYEPMRFTQLWDQFRTASAPDGGKDALVCVGANVDQRDALFCSVHLHENLLDHGVPEAVARMRALADGRPIILAGDLNADATDSVLDPLYVGASGAGAFAEVDGADRAYFPASCRHLATCRSGEFTSYPKPDKPPRKIDYMFGSAGQVRWTAGTTAEPGLSKKDHKILLGEANWATDTTAPVTPVVEAPAVPREPDSQRWHGAADLVTGRFTEDDIDDLVVRWWNGAVDLYPGRGDGTLGAPRVIRSSDGGGWSDATDIAAGDFDGDGWDDLAVRWSRNSLFVYYGAKAGIGWSRPALDVWSLNGVVEMTAGSVDGDVSGNRRDSVVIRREDGSLAAFKIKGSDREPRAAVEPTVELLPKDALSDARHIALGDAYGPGRGAADRRDDLFLRLNSGSLYAFAGSAQGFAGAAWQHIHSAPSDGKNPVYDTVLGDFDGSGVDDLIVRNRHRPREGTDDGDEGQLRRYELQRDAVVERSALASAPLGWRDVPHFAIGAFDSPGSSTELRRWSTGAITGVLGYDGNHQAADMKWLNVQDLAVANLAGDSRDDVVLQQGDGRVAVVPAPFVAGTWSAPGTTVTAPAGGWCPGAPPATLAMAELAAGDVVGDDRDDLVVRCAGGAVLGYPVSPGLTVAAPVTIRAAGDTGVLGMHVTRVGDRRAVVLRAGDGSATVAVEADSGGYAAPVPYVPAGTWAGTADVVRDDATGAIYAVWNTGGATRYPAGATPTPSATVTIRSADDVAVDHYRYAIDGGITDQAPWIDDREGRGVIPLGSLSPGSHVLRVRAVDRAGNASATLEYPLVVPAA